MAEPQESAAEREEKAAIRRRWITIGEVLAVLGVVISALALWNSWVERRANERDRAEQKAEQGAASHTLILKASGGGKRLTLAPHDSEQVIQGQTLLFASSLGLGAIDTTDARIEADWVKRAVKKAHEDDDKKRPGDARMPVAITTRFTAGGGAALEDTALYDIGYKESGGGLLGGTDVELKGLVLVQRVSAAKAQAKVDALWKARGGQ
ncbi:MAG: hypothetical protein QOE79_2497 [Sphingomonadales bacterium]|jgi:hypothetical protein|nr:hypothetical protein [Sphingomonadales bacterium]